MKKLTEKEDANLIRAIQFTHGRIVGDPSSLCEDGRDLYYIFEDLLMEKLNPLLDDNFRIEVENDGTYCFRYKSCRYGDTEVYKFSSLDSLSKD